MTDNNEVTFHLTTKKIIIIVISLQLAFIGLVLLDKLGVEIPALRQLIGIVYLTFVPGFLILRLLRVNTENILNTFLYSMGLSLSFLMFIGALINFLYPLIGISKPISEMPLIITITIIILFLCFICYLRDKDYSRSISIFINIQLFSPLVLSLLFLLFLAISGTYLVNFYHNNVLLLLLLFVISAIPLLVTFSIFPKDIFPLVVWIISISLLFHASLVSPYVWGADINFELYHASLVKNNQIWDPTIPNNHNAMLSLVMLVPIYSYLLHMDITWIFKIIYPLIFSFVPVGLYKLFKNQVNERRISFLSCCFFMFVITFYTEMLALARQQIAEFFLVLILLIITTKKEISTKNILLLIIFSFSLVVSHYGTSYWFMFSIILAYFILPLLKNKEAKSTITYTFVFTYIVFVWVWYVYTNGAPFKTAISLISHIVNNFNALFSPNAAEGADIIIKSFKSFDPIKKTIIYLNIISQFFISVGILMLLLKRTQKFSREYIALSIVSFIWDVAAVSVPYLTYGGFGATRLYHLSLFLLAPFFVIGFTQFFKKIIKLKSVKETSVQNSVSVFLMIFLLFNTGVVSELCGYELSSQALSYSHNWGDSEDLISNIKFHNWYTNDRDVFSSKWIGNYRENPFKIYADMFRSWRLEGYGGIPRDDLIILTNKTKIEEDCYIYLGKFNTNKDLLTYTRPAGRVLMWWNITEVLPELGITNKIYANSGSEIYYR